MRQGTLARNGLRGFPVNQLDLALRRKFNLTDRTRLLCAAEAFNFFNHPNFADPTGRATSLGTRLAAADLFLPNATFGEAAPGFGGARGQSFAALYDAGGPRTLRLSLRLEF
jgi:hypothetical protein